MNKLLDLRTVIEIVPDYEIFDSSGVERVRHFESQETPALCNFLQHQLDALAAAATREIQKKGFQVLVNNHWSGSVGVSIYNTTNGGEIVEHYEDGLLEAIAEFVRSGGFESE